LSLIHWPAPQSQSEVRQAATRSCRARSLPVEPVTGEFLTRHAAAGLIPASSGPPAPAAGATRALAGVRVGPGKPSGERVHKWRKAAIRAAPCEGGLGAASKAVKSRLIDTIGRERFGGNRTIAGVTSSDVNRRKAAAEPSPKHRWGYTGTGLPSPVSCMDVSSGVSPCRNKSGATDVVTRGGAAR